MSELVKVHKADLAGPRSGARAVLTEGVDLGELRQRLEWMTSQVLPIGPLALLDVRHLGSRVPISRVPYSREDEKCTPHALTERIASLVQSDARQMPGAFQTYTVEAYYGDSHYPSEQMRLRARWDDEEDEAVHTRGAPSSGMQPHETKLLARAFSASMDANVRLTKQESVERREFVRTLIDDNREMREEVRRLSRELTESEKARQDALDTSHERLLKTERNKELLATFRRLTGVAELMLPVFLNKRFGLDLPMPAHAHPIMEQLRQLYERVTEDEKTMLAIMQALSKNEAAMVLFGSLMSHLQDRRDLDQARANLTAHAEKGKLPETASQAAE